MAFDNIRSAYSIDDDHLLNGLTFWENKLQERFFEVSRLEPSKRIVKSKSLNMKELLDALPPKERKRFMAEYSEIIGFNKVIESGILPSSVVMPGTTKNNELRRFSLDPNRLSGSGTSALETIYNRMHINVDPLSPVDSVDRYSFGGNILRSDYLKELLESNKQMLPGLNSGMGITGSNVVVFDTETAGILEESGVRQVSASKMLFDPNAKTFSSPQKIFDRHFKTSRMQMGMIAENGVADDFMSSHFENLGVRYANQKPFAGDDFVAGLRPFLDELKNADHIVGHNVQFDINQIFVGLQNTQAYQSDTSGFKGYLDEVMEASLRPGKVKDTLEMARAYMPDLKPSDVLLNQGKATAYSIENLLLSTNLADLVRGELGDDEFKKAFGITSGSLHASDIDTTVTGYLLKFINSGQLQKGQLSSVDPVFSALKKSIISSYAPTPISNIANIGHIDKRVFSSLMREAATDPDNSYLTAGRGFYGEKAFSDLMSSGPDTLYAAMQKLHEETETPVTLKITPLEQEMELSRRGFETARDVTEADIVGSIGNWRDYAGQGKPYQGILNKFSTLFKHGERPSLESFSDLQDKLASHGVPFAGISMPERWFTGAMSMAATEDKDQALWKSMSNIEQTSALLGEDLGISRFKKAEQAYVSQSARNVTIPLEILREAETAGVIAKTSISGGDDLGYMGYSAYKTESGRKRVALNYLFSGNEEDQLRQSQALHTWLVDRLQDDSAMIGDRAFKSYFRDNPFTATDLGKALETSATSGIQVASMEGRAGTIAYNMVESFQQGILADRSKIAMRAGFLSDDDNIVRVGAWHLGRFGDDGFNKSYINDMQVAGKRLNDLEEIIKQRPRMTSALLEISKRGGDVESIVKQSVNAYEKVRSVGPKVALGAIAGGVVYSLYKRHRENSIYDETLQQQSYEGKSRGYIDESMINYGKNNMDPLATAGTIRQLRDSRIGHTKMGPGKYSDIYGGY